EKKELASYAHSLGKKLKIQQVGKSGITDSVAASFVENLESNELLKLKIHNSCPGELPDVIKELEVTTGSVAVGQIGRSVILYRPSLTKLKAEEKKREARRMYVRKGLRPRPTELQLKAAQFRSKRDESMERRRPARNLSSHGRRGRSRNEDP
ncbi:RNA-binding CRS1 / YhbY (CRM) domain protein, partial [Thalictrum thalictroides]